MSIALQISQLYSHNSSVNGNFTTYLLKQATLQDLIESLIMNPPLFEIGTDNHWVNASAYEANFDRFLKMIQLYFSNDR